MAQNTLIDLMKEHASRTSAPSVPGVPRNLHASGMIEAGNIDHVGRPSVSLGDGRTGTVQSMSFEDDQGREVLIPTIFGGKKHDFEAAIQQYERTGEHLGIFDTPAHATAYSKALSDVLGGPLFAGPPRPRR